jgi:predicted amidohydrolase
VTRLPEPFRVAAIQMVSGPSVAENLGAAADLIAKAARRRARLAVLPEWFCLMGNADGDKLAARERDGDGPIQSFLARTAAEHGLWLVAGSVPLDCSDPKRVRNACLVYDDSGRRVARYDKIHLFDYTPIERETREERYRESATIEPGTEPVAIDSPFGRIALSTCYDVRFPELYRRLAPMDLITVPSAFTVSTGIAHWEVLLRARAVENLAWVIAPAQGGRHPSGRQTHGHTMIVDPWGKVIDRLPQGPGVVMGEIDPSYQQSIRASLPALAHRVF